MTCCGYVTIVGRPNVGKSTLLNRLLGQKISITSRKPQTTRHNLLGIMTRGETQIMFVDTPGLHTREARAINRYMNKSARRALSDVDLVLFMVDKGSWTEDDEMVLSLVKEAPAKVVVAINKIDEISDKSRLLPVMARLGALLDGVDIIPISAESGKNLNRLLSVINRNLPESPFYFDDNQVTDRSVRFLAAEIIREKLMRQLGDELPYAVTIQVERFDKRDKITRIDASIYVEKEGQKRIVIGKGGSRIKRVGIDARRDIEALLQSKVMLDTRVKVKASWSDDERALKSLGYDDGDHADSRH